LLSAHLAALCLPLLAACTDGYPTDDVPQIDLARMSQAQLLAELNTLGAQPRLGKRWRYALQAHCELEISVRNGSTDRRLVGLEDAEMSTRSADGVTEIQLTPKAGDDAQAVTVLETRRWSDTVKVRSLITQLEQRCGRQSEPTA